MYYLRGALSAASGYYKDLSAINPSTLTGAIDVIVVERPSPDGGNELACSPFHVRFGKWQVLRPSDRTVTVQLNGKPVPFNMKIGEAGEAFWVFETDDDVPEELITSPVLEPTKPPPPTPKPGPFGASDDDVEDYSQTDTGAEEKIALAKAEAAREVTGADTEEEPDYLDLDAPPAKRKPPPLDKDALARINAEASTSEPSPARYTPSSFLTHASDLGKAAIHDAKATVRPPRLDSPVAATAQETLELRGQDVRPPDVVHGHGVALDLAGYHARDVSDRTVVGVDHGRRASGSRSLGNADDLSRELQHERFANGLRAKGGAQSDSDLSPGTSRPSSPEYSRPASYSTRATSEPPDGSEGRSQPEYEWDWGAFPLKTPAVTHDGPYFFPTEPGSPETRAADEDLAFKSRRGLVQLGTLTSSPTGSFLLDMDNKKFEFELSLCGALPTDEQDMSRRFAQDAVSYQLFLDDESVVRDPALVIRWNSKYISRQDRSPLFAALASWREVALGLRRTAMVEDDPLSSSDERDPAPDRATPTQSARTTSTWSRWWRGSKTQAAVGSSQTLPVAATATKERPSLKLTASEPMVFSEAVTPPPISNSLPLSPAPPPQKRYVKTLRLTSDQLKALNLHPGLNTITFSLSTTGVVACTARIFFWENTDLVVVSDIDGTITKSDALGHVMTFMGRDWTHTGVAKLYTDICRNGYKILYLTSRAIGQAGSTRHYLKGINQDNYQLPEGPVIMSPDRLFASLHREVIVRRPEVFKMACLQDIRSLFGSHNPFYAGFGNRITDAASYLKVDIPSARIFTIEYSGEVKMELLERAGFKSSYIHMTDLVDQMFPPVHRSVSPAFTDLNYWRPPLSEFELPDLTPPSPALSARSGRSTLSRFNPALSAISLLSTRSRSFVSGQTSRATSPERNGGTLPLHMQDVQKSLEELKIERERADEEYIAQLRRKKSLDSMPGSLPNAATNGWGDIDEGDEEEGPDDEEDEEGEYDEDEDPEAQAEDAFDEDLLITGEMENVPFL
ncbi:LNS2-domain-containing protein [Exidia glandulosa HHB12029]|uniref:phosphatidate phosphatase n=1 Tax=Exidia glandulosa HHB12029 TaxID=1314781 RepID=A0A165QXB0_EXIGL|nr:LNS2-domain-containing protein [Exidia glandulosa HHB12029]